MPDAIKVIAPAKVNLYLGVGARRGDGYHDVRTVLQAISLSDTVTIEPGLRLSLVCRPDLGLMPDENLAWKAAIAFGAALELSATVSISIDKQIPHGAGLGGGSSDAAAVLLGLAKMNGIRSDDDRLLAAAHALGSDVPFFLDGGTGLYDGRGDDLVHRLPSLDAHVVIIKPDDAVRTTWAYEQFDRDPQQTSGPEAVVAALLSQDVEVLAHSLSNNFEKAAAQLVPESAEVLNWARGLAETYGAELAGSGAAVYALCPDEDSAHRVVELADEVGWWAYAAQFRSRGVEIVSEEGASA